MKKILSNYQLIKNILLVVATSLIMVFALVFFVRSINVNESGFKANTDYLIALIASFFLFSYTLQVLISDIRTGSCKSLEARLVSFGVVFTLFAFYPLGVFFKGLAKGSDFSDIQVYLYVAIVSFVLLLVVILDALKLKFCKCKDSSNS